MIIDVDKGYQNLLDAFAELGASAILVGIRQDKGSEVTDSGATLAEIATFNEFGTRHIPARSFLRSTVDENATEYSKLILEATDRAVDGANPERELGIIGLNIVKDVQLKITKLKEPANALATQIAKGRKKHLPEGTLIDNPLIDTGRMRASIDFEVQK